SSEFKTRLARAARKRKVSVSELVRVSVEKEVPVAGRGFLLGRLKAFSAGPSTYDPAKPAFAEDEWETRKR
ncbi:MAG: hypothetical protein ABIR80_15635, partial [Opitutaceae bacterium]